MAESKKMETMLAREDHKEAETILSVIQGLDEESLKSFYDFTRGIKFGMELQKKQEAAAV